MMSIRNILTISRFESKVLWRNWFFRIVGVAGILFLTIFNLAEMSTVGDFDWDLLSNGWVFPYLSLLFIAVPQAAAVIFLATGVIRKDKKLDTNEVFFVRPISNIDYVLGKALALLKLFFLLNLVLLCVPLIVAMTNPLATINLVAFGLYPVLTSVPAIVFITGISFLLVTVIRNQPIAIVLLLGMGGVEVIYYFDKFSNILDFPAFRLSMLASEISGFVDIEFALWQRAFYFITGIALMFLTAFLLDRLPGNRGMHRTTALVGGFLLLVSSFIMANLWDMRQETIDLREEMISVNGRWADVPEIEIVSHNIELRWEEDRIVSTSDMRVKNSSTAPLDTLFFTLNPGLSVDSMLIDGSPVEFERDLHIVFAGGISIAPGQFAEVRVTYHGGIKQAVAHLEVDEKRYEESNDYIIFSLPKKYSFLEDDYVLLTKDVLWYPDTEIGYNRKSPPRKKQSFTQFSLTVTAPEGKTVISQGALTIDGAIHRFNPEYPLPHLSLVIGDYLKKEIVVDSISYAFYHYPKNDFFLKELDQLGDTLSYLITDVVDEYEDAQQLKYPFKRLHFVEVPHAFTAFNKVHESHQAFVQPETVFVPEEGGEISQFDFRDQLNRMDEQAQKANQVLTRKQKQANVFNDLIKRVFTKQIGEEWVNDEYDFDDPDYSVFPLYYDFNSGVVSREWTLLNRSIANYLRNDKLVQVDYTRQINGISFAEECNTLMRTTSLTKILTESEFNKINRSVSLKSQHLFSYIGHTIGEDKFKNFLYDWVNGHQHELTTYSGFREAILTRFGVDIDPIIREVYSKTSQAAFEIFDVQKYEVLDVDRKRYQVVAKVKNSGDSDGVIEVRFNSKESEDENSFAVMKEGAADAPGRLSVIKRGETKQIGFVLDEKPNVMTINTIISRNIPSVITVSMGTLSRREGAPLFDGERVVEGTRTTAQYEVIVDNEDPGFSSFSPIKPTMLKQYLDSQKDVEQKYYGEWNSSYATWQATTGSDFFGNIIRSAHFTRSGSGEKTATWTPELREEGFYDIYVYMRGKNQNAYTGNDGDSRQYDYHYVIRNGDGTDNIKFNLTNAEPGWNYLGSYYFNKTGGSVSLTDECDLWTVYADAVKWVKQ